MICISAGSECKSGLRYENIFLCGTSRCQCLFCAKEVYLDVCFNTVKVIFQRLSVLFCCVMCVMKICFTKVDLQRLMACGMMSCEMNNLQIRVKFVFSSDVVLCG